ncbi:hypothetical protein HYU12_00715 [Candidatus Woesearchaeota archaeon]|nr:hypothetical protein [Candidatus Woesearchaeota archaeon]
MKKVQKFDFYAGALAASVLLVLLVIGAELFPTLKELLKSVFTHHWVGKVVLSAAAFAAAGFFYRGKTIFGMGIGKAAWYAVVGAFAVIFLFFVGHFLFW